jgi:uncharacterized protein (DUF1330 family)
MTACAICDVEIRDTVRYQDYLRQVKPALEAAGPRHLVRGCAHTVFDGDWLPRRIVVLEFPSMAACECFFHGAAYQPIKSIRDECSRLSPFARSSW